MSNAVITEIKVDIAKLQSWLAALDELPHKLVRRLIDDISGHATEQLQKAQAEQQAAQAQGAEAPPAAGAAPTEPPAPQPQPAAATA